MEDEKDAFYVVRKGDIVGIFKNFADCQAQAALSPLDPSISIFKGHGLTKETESYFVSHGLHQASFSMSATDLQEGLFGPLSVCPFQVGNGSNISPASPQKHHHDSMNDIAGFNMDAGGSKCPALNRPNKSIKLENYVEPQAAGLANPAPNGRSKKHVDSGLNIFSASPQQHHHHESMNDIAGFNTVHSACQSCSIEFDGASKGNPGLAGAGAVLRAKDGSQVWLLREGVGIATNNVAEYRSVILGLRTALQKGFKHVTIQGDSLLVCNQIMGKWKTKNENMANLCKDALQLKKQFVSFSIEHVPRELNSAADAQANRAINLRDRQVEIEMTK